MDKQILYHGSPHIIDQPSLDKSKSYNDYGQGFYCTEHLELAKEWASTEGTDGYANRYQLDTQALKILRLSDEPYITLNWLALLMRHRKVRLSTPLSKHGHAHLMEYFLPDFENYDAIIGYRADDSYFSFARAFLNNEISLQQLGLAMRLGKLGEQFVLKSAKAFDAIQFLDYSICDHTVYYAKRKARDEEARAMYQEMLRSTGFLDGIFMRDIIREEMKQDDIRLR